MKATEVLEQENRVIEQVASACAACADVLEQGVRVPFDVLNSLVDFFRKYEDRYHRREEELLLAMLREKGVPVGSCPMAVIGDENQKLTELIRQLPSAVRIYIESNGTVTSTLIDTLSALAKFFPDHIWKEDFLLLPMADKVLSEEDQRSLKDSLHLIDSTSGAEARSAVHMFGTAIDLCTEDAAWPQQIHFA